MSAETGPQAGQQKNLKKVAGPMLLWGIAVGAVVSGDYYGWNAGLGFTGYWGYLVALAIMGLMYLGLSLVIGELGAAIPHSGGAYAYVRTALGKVWGYIAGVSVLLEFVFAPVAVALTVGAYVQVLFPNVPILLSAAIMYGVSIVLHLSGAAGSMKVEFVVTALAVLGLLVFAAIGLPDVSVANLNQYSDGAIFPNGISGLWAALPLAAWFFFAIESLPMSAEETRNPAKDMPRALIWSWITLAIIGVMTLTVASGVGDADFPDSAAPLTSALQNVVGDQGWIVPTIAIFSLIALIASFHAILLAYSRQIFALSRAGYLPAWLSVLNGRNVPTWGLVVPGLIGYAFCIIGDTILADAIPVLITLSVLVAAVSYMLMMIAAIVLRRRRPEMNRPYRVPGGEVLMWLSLVIAFVLIPASLVAYPIAFVVGAVVIGLFLVYYYAISSKRVGDRSAEEELSALEEAEAELK
ncbi:MAG: ethanolamine permease [Beutenbergiaceae bacterium]